MDLEAALERCVAFTRQLVSTPSMSGREAAAAQLTADEMLRLGFDHAHVDDAGNAVGRVRGREPGPGALVFNAHLDHVDPGEPGLWRHPPYAAEMADGRIYGRGTADIKGPLAVQIHAVGAVLAAGLRPRRDVVVCAVVDEEVGGGGAKAWARRVDYPIDLIVLGEPSDNRLALGHRGIRQLWVTFHGRSAHASAPERASNPNYDLAAFLDRLPAAAGRLRAHPVLGPTTVSPTVVEVDTKSPNVTPAWTRVLLDFRTATESTADLCAFIAALAAPRPHTIGDAWAEDPLAPVDADGRAISGFYTPPHHPAVLRVAELLAGAVGREPEQIAYRFATDGRHFTGLGAAIIGYSAAEEEQAHVADESIAIAKMAVSLRGHVALVSEY